ncbi:MAG: response regulator, partial [Desulfobacteria bacterium]
MEEYIIPRPGMERRLSIMPEMKKPDLIIIDIMMPGKIDGIEATRILKNDPETRGSIIIMLTSKGQ